MRRPLAAMKQMGARRFIAAQLMLGGSILSALIHGPLLVFCLACILIPGLGLAPYSLALFASGCLVSSLSALCAPGAKGWRRWVLVATLPFYLPLQSIAAVRAIYELAMAPHLWSKTPHGLTASRPDMV